jgi:DNA polymerase-1
MAFQILQPEVKLDSRAWLESKRYRLVTTELELKEWANTLRHGQDLGADFETNKLNRFDNMLPVGFGLSKEDHEAIYLPTAHTTDSHLNLPEAMVRDFLIRLDKDGYHTAWWNYPFDGSIVAWRWQYELEHWEEALLATWISDPTQRAYKLKEMARKLLGTPTIGYDDVTTGRPFQELSPLEAVSYVGGDSDNTRQLWLRAKNNPWFQAQKLVYEKIEKPFALVFRDEMRNRVGIHRERLMAIHEELGELDEEARPLGGKLLAYYQQVRDALGRDINIRSPPQVAEALTQLGVEIRERTDTGQIATGEEVLARYSHPACKAITEYRSMMALKTNYADKLLMACNHFGEDMLRFPFRQHGAPTGRTACGGEGRQSDRHLLAGFCPLNVQSTPKVEKRDAGRVPDLRKVIVARPPSDPTYKQWRLVKCDYSQLQMRIAANLSGEDKWIQAFREGHDFHLTNARLAYGEEVGPERRDIGKTMSFAMLFGAHGATVAEHGKIPEEVAEKLLKTFKSGTPKLQKWISDCHQHARQHGWISTYFGRRRPLHYYFADANDEWRMREGERLAVNTPVQGAEADVAKWGAARAYRMVRERGWTDVVQQVLWVHDELVLAVHESVLEQAVPAIKEAMQVPIPKWQVPLTVDAGVGESWSEAKG